MEREPHKVSSNIHHTQLCDISNIWEKCSSQVKQKLNFLAYMYVWQKIICTHNLQKEGWFQHNDVKRYRGKK